MSDEQMEEALKTRDPRLVAKLIRSRGGAVTFYRKGDRKRAETYARKKQNELFWSKESGELNEEIDKLIDLYRILPIENTYRGVVLDEINKKRSEWQKRFGKFDEFYWYFAKTLEIKNFIKFHRHDLTLG